MYTTLAVFLAGIVILLVLVGKFRLSAFLGLLAAAMTIGVLSGLGPLPTLDVIKNGFSATILDIGLVIIFGTMLGKLLEASGATTRMALFLIDIVGKKLSSLAMAISGYVISIPVFSDAAFVMLSPLARSVARSARQARAVIGVSLASGLLATNVFFPPTPGPLAAAGMLNIDVGKVMIFGGLVAIVYTLFGWAYAHFYLARKSADFFVYDDELPAAREDDTAINIDEKSLPSTVSAFLPLAIPLALILTNTVSKMVFEKDSPAVAVTSFLGEPTVALIIGVTTAGFLYRRQLGKELFAKINSSLADAGPIVFIVASGGALAEVLKSSGVGTAIAEMVVNTGLPFILIPFLIGAIIKMINGSGTMALITTITICVPLVQAIGIDPTLLFLSAATGASICCHVNDSFFWVYNNTLGFNMNTSLKTLSVANVVSALGALMSVFLIDLFIL